MSRSPLDLEMYEPMEEIGNEQSAVEQGNDKKAEDCPFGSDGGPEDMGVEGCDTQEVVVATALVHPMYADETLQQEISYSSVEIGGQKFSLPSGNVYPAPRVLNITASNEAVDICSKLCTTESVLYVAQPSTLNQSSSIIDITIFETFRRPKISNWAKIKNRLGMSQAPRVFSSQAGDEESSTSVPGNDVCLDTAFKGEMMTDGEITPDPLGRVKPRENTKEPGDLDALTEGQDSSQEKTSENRGVSCLEKFFCCKHYAESDD